jgi:shikimate dehydrogenase
LFRHCGHVPPLPCGGFTGVALAYDMVYAKGVTPFLRFAQQQGAARIADGAGMLVEQAAESFFVWRGLRPDPRELIARLKTCRSGAVPLPQAFAKNRFAR